LRLNKSNTVPIAALSISVYVPNRPKLEENLRNPFKSVSRQESSCCHNRPVMGIIDSIAMGNPKDSTYRWERAGACLLRGKSKGPKRLSGNGKV